MATSVRPNNREPGVEHPVSGAGRIPVRAILVGLLLLPVNAFWLVQMEMATNQSASTGGTAGPYPTTFSLFANVVCFIAALSVVNGLLRRFGPRAALSQAELLIVYVMLTIGSCLTSVDFLDVLIPMLGHPTRYGTASNNWQDLFIRWLPRWFYVRDHEALNGWYTGSVNPYTWSRISAWLVPLAAWGAFILVLLGTMLCINALLRRQWTRSEKLSYPIIQLPMEMTDPTGAFYRQRLLWAGFGVASGISLLNGMAYLFPSVPSIPVRNFDISPFVTARPWSAIGWTPISLYPFAIGLGFLLPLDMLFSSWFFYFLWKGQRVASDYLGWSNNNPTFPYVNEQCFGAYMGIALLALWVSRRHLAGIVREAWRKAPGSVEGPGARAALMGAAAGVSALMGFFGLAGLPLWVCAAGIGIYLAIALAVTRMRAELGPPAHDLHNGGPDYILTAAFGTRAFTAQQLGVLTYFYWFNRAYRSLSMPAQLEAFKIGERKAISPRSIVLSIAAASVVGLLSGYWALYHFGYRNGAEARMAPHLTYFGWEAFNRLNTWISTPRDRDVPAMIAIGVGLATALLLHAGRMRFAWWPFHPLGLAVSGSWSMNTIWLPMLIAWTCKVCILRYGGLRSYRQALSFFYGLILGDYVVGCLWPFVGWLIHANVYSFQQ